MIFVYLVVFVVQPLVVPLRWHWMGTLNRRTRLNNTFISFAFFPVNFSNLIGFSLRNESMEPHTKQTFYRLHWQNKCIYHNIRRSNTHKKKLSITSNIHSRKLTHVIVMINKLYLCPMDFFSYATSNTNWIDQLVP